MVSVFLLLQIFLWFFSPPPSSYKRSIYCNYQIVRYSLFRPTKTTLHAFYSIVFDSLSFATTLCSLFVFIALALFFPPHNTHVIKFFVMIFECLKLLLTANNLTLSSISHTSKFWKILILYCPLLLLPFCFFFSFMMQFLPIHLHRTGHI